MTTKSKIGSKKGNGIIPCNQCKYCINPYEEQNPQYPPKCQRPIPKIDFVTGKESSYPLNYDCQHERLNNMDDHCGKNAKFFKPKKD